MNLAAEVSEWGELDSHARPVGILGGRLSVAQEPDEKGVDPVGELVVGEVSRALTLVVVDMGE